MTNICAAIGLAQVERADEFIAQKRRLAEAYADGLAGLPVKVHGEAPNVVHSYWMVSVLTGSSCERDKLREALANDGIETRPTFYPVHTMPMYATGFERLMIAEEIGARGVVLPSWPGLSAAHINDVCQSIARFYQTQ